MIEKVVVVRNTLKTFESLIINYRFIELFGTIKKYLIV